MSSGRRIVIVVLSIALAGVLGALYYRHYGLYPSTDDAYVDADVVQIVAQVSGPLVNLAVSDNQAVEAGDLLFEIDPRPFQIAVENAKAQVDKTGQNVSAQSDAVASAEAQFQRAQAALRLAEVQFRRVAPLAEQGAVPYQDRDKAQAQLDEARSGLAKAQAQLTKAQHELGEMGASNADTRMAIAQLESAQLQLSYCRVTAPVNGYVTNLTLEPGKLCQCRQPDSLARRHRQLAGGRLPEGDPAPTHPARAARNRSTCPPIRAFASMGASRGSAGASSSRTGRPGRRVFRA